MAGTAIRTKYSIKSAHAKGFIYIAADKGELQYAGKRNKTYKSETIWNFKNLLKPNTPFPKKTLHWSFYRMLTDKSNLVLKDHVVGPLLPVLVHELGHTMGVQHNNDQNILDIDAPAKIIEYGLISKGELKSISEIFSKSLLGLENMPMKIGFEWWHSTRNYVNDDSSRAKSPLLFDFLYFKHPVHQMYFPKTPIILFDFGKKEGENSLNFVSLTKGNLSYKVTSKYQLEISKREVSISPNKSVTFRNLGVTHQDHNTERVTGRKYDPISNSWNQVPFGTFSSIITNQILPFWNTHLEGKIKLPDNKFFKFKLNINYTGASNLFITDPVTKYEKEIRFTYNLIRTYGKQKLPAHDMLFEPVLGEFYEKDEFGF